MFLSLTGELPQMCQRNRLGGRAIQGRTASMWRGTGWGVSRGYGEEGKVLGGRMGCTGDRESRVRTGEWQAKELAVAPGAWSCHHGHF